MKTLTAPEFTAECLSAGHALVKEAKWIRQAETCLADWRAKVRPAPFLRKTFHWEASRRQARILICGLGYYELYLNGRKVGDHVLDPGVTQYDRRVRYVVHEVAEYLVPGTNVLGVILGNGWYNCHTPEVWHFDKASWRDDPKLRLQLESGGACPLVSDESWKAASGPILFDGLRNGETYDARLELDGWLSPAYDDRAWKNCVRANPPGGILREQTMPPCKVMETLQAVGKQNVNGAAVYDFGQNISGWCRLRVAGARGAVLRISYGERRLSDGRVDQEHISMHVKVEKGQFQTDCYILKGGGEELWEPRFTYHGFQYAQIVIDGEAEVLQAEARFVHTAFRRTGRFSCSDETLNRLQDCMLRSYKSNFVGIPTDCPHREKNGWTGDAQLAAEAGLYNFAAGPAYAHWLDSFADVQRPSGQLPGIVPSCGWGFNWGSGPAWDSAFLLIAWHIYLHTGDRSSIETHYGSMKRYVDYCSSMSDDGIVAFGLGDWCHVDESRMADPALTSTAYYYTDCLLLAKFAALTGRDADQEAYSVRAAKIKAAFNRRFYQGGGLYAKGEQTALACALHHGLAEDSERPHIAKRLAAAVEANGGKADFGILGAKYVPRALAENGYAELACRLMTQPEFPGWAWWLRQGATTLWEAWRGDSSLNHVMFGDIGAWMHKYLAGVSPDPENPGFRHILIKPHPVSSVNWVRAEYELPNGTLTLHWRKHNGRFQMNLTIPAGSTATASLPDGSVRTLMAGLHKTEAGLPLSK